MAASKTLSAAAKSAFQSAGYTLTPAEEHVAATAEATGFDWAGLLAKLAALAVKIIPIILGEFSSQQTPKAAAPGCVSHHCLCCETLKSAMHTAELAAKHCCECCCE